MHQYLFASADPVNYADPFGLRVCFKGSESEIRDLKKAAEEATQTTFILDGENCVVKESVVSHGGRRDEPLAAAFIKAVNDEVLVLNARFDSTQHTSSGVEIRINRNEATTLSYGVVRTAGGQCLTAPGAVMDLAAAFAHEIGHANKVIAATDQGPGKDLWNRFENIVHRRAGRDRRHAGCH